MMNLCIFTGRMSPADIAADIPLAAEHAEVKDYWTALEDLKKWRNTWESSLVQVLTGPLSEELVSELSDTETVINYSSKPCGEPHDLDFGLQVFDCRGSSKPYTSRDSEELMEVSSKLAAQLVDFWETGVYVLRQVILAPENYNARHSFFYFLGVAIQYKLAVRKETFRYLLDAGHIEMLEFTNIEKPVKA